MRGYDALLDLGHLVVHRCTSKSLKKLHFALEAEKDAIDAEHHAELAKKKFVAARKAAFQSIEEEYPEITNPEHPSRVLAQQGLVVIELPH